VSSTHASVEENTNSEGVSNRRKNIYMSSIPQIHTVAVVDFKFSVVVAIARLPTFQVLGVGSFERLRFHSMSASSRNLSGMASDVPAR
jgi:hypothetical protein